MARHFATVINLWKRINAMGNKTNRILLATSAREIGTANVSKAVRLSLTHSGLIFLLFSLSGCGGTKVLKEPEPLVVTKSLASASDQNLSVTLDWVIYRDGPGTWAKNADWDEYLIRVRNSRAEPIQFTNIKVVDSSGTSVSPGVSRSKLVKGAKQTEKRYKGRGLEVKAGVGTATLLAAGAVTATTVAGAGAVAVYGSGAAVAGLAAGMILAPALAVGGVMRGVNNSKVNNEIEARQTLLPVQLAGDAEKALHIFYPLAPSPRQIEVTYVDASGEHTLIVDTQESLDGLHIVQPQ